MNRLDDIKHVLKLRKTEIIPIIGFFSYYFRLRKLAPIIGIKYKDISLFGGLIKDILELDFLLLATPIMLLVFVLFPVTMKWRLLSRIKDYLKR